MMNCLKMQTKLTWIAKDRKDQCELKVNVSDVEYAHA